MQLLFILLFAFWFGQNNAEAKVPIQPEKAPFGLTVETIREPGFATIIDSKPEFAWIVPDDAASRRSAC